MIINKIETYNGSVHGIFTYNGQVHSFTSVLCDDVLHLSVFCNGNVVSYGLKKAYEPSVAPHIALLGRRIACQMYSDKNKV